MSKESETHNVYEDLKREDDTKKVKPKYNCPRGWLVPVGLTMIGVVLFVAGFVAGYFAVSPTGKTYWPDLQITLTGKN